MAPAFADLLESAHLLLGRQEGSSTSTSNSTAFPGSLPPSREYLTTTVGGLTACVTAMVVCLYLVGVSWVRKYAEMHPKVLNKGSGVRLQKYAPLFYVGIVLAALCEVAIASWLLIQWKFNENYPNGGSKVAIRFILFTSCWTALTSGTYSIVFIHPVWSKHPAASVGSQSLWLLLTWILWVVGAGMLNSNVGVGALDCGEGVVYCGQLKGLFGLAIIQSLTLTAGMATIMWLAWQSVREAYMVNSRPFSVMTRASQMFASAPVTGK